MFQDQITFFFGYFDPTNIFLIIKMNDFRGEVTHTSAKKNVTEQKVLKQGGETRGRTVGPTCFTHAENEEARTERTLKQCFKLHEMCTG